MFREIIVGTRLVWASLLKDFAADMRAVWQTHGPDCKQSVQDMRTEILLWWEEMLEDRGLDN